MRLRPTWPRGTTTIWLKRYRLTVSRRDDGMSGVFVDTSAIIALLVSTDAWHGAARRVFERLKAGQQVLHTTSYVLVETHALIRHRLGAEATERVHDGLESLLRITWVDAELHGRGIRLLADKPRDVSLVDCVSFETMRDLHLISAFEYDAHFRAEGFRQLQS
jgi:predicted nucleic acid-binding protein